MPSMTITKLLFSHSSAGRSVMEPVAHLKVDLPGIGVMGATESGAVVQKEAAIRQVQGGQRNGDSFSQRPPDGKVERGVPLQMGRDVARSIGEARPVIQVAARRDVPRKIEVKPGVERLALIVIQQEVTAGGRREVR